MTALRTALPLARIPALLMLVWATAPPVEEMRRATARLDVSSYWGPWALVSLISMAFVVVMLMGRRHWHPWPVLAVEAGVAATVAFVPPISWLNWGGINDLWFIAMTAGFAQPLAVAWLGVVGLRAFHQLRGAPVIASAPDDGGRGPKVRGPVLDLVDHPKDA